MNWYKKAQYDNNTFTTELPSKAILKDRYTGEIVKEPVVLTIEAIEGNFSPNKDYKVKFGRKFSISWMDTPQYIRQNIQTLPTCFDTKWHTLENKEEIIRELQEIITEYNNDEDLRKMETITLDEFEKYI